MSKKWDSNDWQISPFNFSQEVQKDISISSDVIISDCTLRDGEQQAGLVFTMEDKIQIAQELDRIGVHEIESGMPAVSEEDKHAIEKICSLNLNSKITALARARKEDIDITADSGVWGVSISLPIGDIQRKYKLKMTDEEYLTTCLKLIEYAKSKGLHVILSPYDTTRVRIDFLERLLKKLKSEQTLDRIRLVDTVGSVHPVTMRYLVNKMKSFNDQLPIEVHCHDDFGLATANTLAALEAGAQIASVTVNGIGERSGNCALEEVVTSLKILYGIDIGIDLSKLKETSKKIEAISKIKLQPHKAIVGENSFTHESGMIVAGIMNNNFTGEPYLPELVGQKREFIIGKKSGVKSLKMKLEELEFPIIEKKLEQYLTKIKEFAVSNKRALTENEIIEICENINAKSYLGR